MYNKPVNTNILVIGGSGFMGSHTADELSNRGYKVKIFDSQQSNYIRKDQIFIKGSVLYEDELAAALDGIAIVYYFAGIAEIKKAKDNPIDTINLNVMGLTKTLDVCVQKKIRRFVYASTMYVHSNYGSFYRASKQAAEIIIRAFNEKYEIGYSLLRYGSLYGSRSQDWNGIYSFIKQIINESKIDYAGNGEELREYINVKDAAKLSVDILDERYVNKAINVSGQQMLRVSELIDLIFEILGKEKKIIYQSKMNLQDHYGNTPYRFTPQSAIKLVPQEYVDLSQGLFDLISEIEHSNDH